MGVIGKLFTSLFFSAFLGMGLLFAAFIGREIFGEMQSWMWTAVDCQIVASRVDDGTAVEKTSRSNRPGGAFYFEVKYTYQVEGKTYTSERCQFKDSGFSDYGKAAQLVAKYPAGSSTRCYVNPANPSEAVLKRGHPLYPLVLLFPLVFVAIGAGGIYFQWRPKPAKSEVESPVSERISPSKGRALGVAFFLAFLILGSVGLYWLLVRPVQQMINARNWREVPCEVISSTVETHRGDDGSTYSVNIFYRYEIDGQEHKSNRYDFMGGSSSGYEGKASVVRKLPPGTRAVCFVDPADPDSAVLSREASSTMWFGLIPGVFALVGAGGIWMVLRQPKGKSVAAAMPFGKATSGSGFPPPSGRPRMPAGRAGAHVFQAKPWHKLLGMFLIAAFWNGIVSIFVFQVFKSWRSGHLEWFLALFMIPFVAVGLAMIGGVIYFALAMFNPRPKLTVAPSEVALGQALQVAWEFTGDTSKIVRLHLYLEGREEARYRRGTSTSTDKSVFARVTIVEVLPPRDLRRGAATVTVPAHLMHSFDAPNNKIIWTVCIQGEIHKWPDVVEEFPITVTPGRPTQAGV